MPPESTNTTTLKLVNIPNATVGKAYSHVLQLQAGNIEAIEMLSGLEGTGLVYSPAAGMISGCPLSSGNFEFKVHFVSADSQEIIQPLMLLVNPDPRSLWRNLESDQGGTFAKPDELTATGTLGDRRVVLVSKRGRSHANTGGYREDDGLFRQYDNGWNLVAVSDGAGSAHLSRKGSELACSLVSTYFENQLNDETAGQLASLLELYSTENADAAALNQLVLSLLSGAVQFVHKEIAAFATSIGEPLAAFHATLIFVLFRKFPFGNVLLSFGVGDCPVGLICGCDAFLLNKLDVGEYGGGTRFITMPGIFSSDQYYSRFKLRIVKDYDFLFLMTDGIYDPKFVVEANLEQSKNWMDFLKDLKGENEEGTGVDFSADISDTGRQLSTWMNFWSAGNHDDRTLAIVY